MNRLRTTIPLMFLVLLAAASTARGADFVSATEARRWQENKTSFYLVDVRAGQLFKRKHIEGAINIPAFIVHKKGLVKNETVVLYDAGIGTVEAKEAAEKMSAAGYARVFLLEGGLARWEAAGLPLKSQMGVINSALVEFLSVEELARAKRDGVVMTLVDLREPALFKAGSIPGAVNAQPAVFLQASTGWAKDDLVVLFDGGDGQSEKQAELLRRAGFKLIRFLYGGFPEWKRQNAS